MTVWRQRWEMYQLPCDIAVGAVGTEKKLLNINTNKPYYNLIIIKYYKNKDHRVYYFI